MNGISIVICCYNSAELLPKTLHHIAQQKIASTIPWELIIVNNNSSDDTKKIAEQFINKNPFIKAHIVDEFSPGLSIARHKGFETSSYEYMLLCDDDNWLENDYVETA
ncbi:MAG: glycosyltransferase family 2 protein, partial [Flavisolibacter sp.]|nr:glycosyltransferase family 2 protein [Flavisolibacter sp.]